MPLAVFTALVGLSVAPGHIHPVIGFHRTVVHRRGRTQHAAAGAAAAALWSRSMVRSPSRGRRCPFLRYHSGPLGSLRWLCARAAEVIESATWSFSAAFGCDALCLRLAISGHSVSTGQCPLLRVKRKSRRMIAMSAFDQSGYEQALTGHPLQLATHFLCPQKFSRPLTTDSTDHRSDYRGRVHTGFQIAPLGRTYRARSNR